jgi:hypothetical protein
MDKAIAYGLSLVDTSYGLWDYKPLSATNIAPFWIANLPPPDKAAVKSVCCAGLLNLMLRAASVPIPYCDYSIGGTHAYYEYFKDVAKKFDPNISYPVGTILGRKYHDHIDQGHVAMVYNEDQKILQSTPGGVTDIYTVASSNDYFPDQDYYHYYVLPSDWLGSKL